jgi:UDP-glucose-4-epimerase GalE
MKVLVTGGTGYIGAHVVRALAERGHEPIVLDDLSASTADRAGDFPFEQVSVGDTSRLFDVFARHRPEGVIHLAGSISVAESVREPDRYWGNNLGGGASLLLACARFPVRVFLFSSTAAVYGNATVSPIPESAEKAPTCPYGASKLEFERLLHAGARAIGMRSSALRYFNAAGDHVAWKVGEMHDPEEHLIPRVIRAFLEGRAAQVYGNDYPTPDGTCVRDYIHVLDLAEAHVRVLESTTLESGQSFNVGTGSGESVLAVVRAVGRHLGVEPQIEFLPRRPGDPVSLIADPSALLAQLSWRAVHSSLDEIVGSAVAWERIRLARR